MGEPRTRDQKAIDDVTDETDLKYWDGVHREASTISDRYKLPMEWAMVLAVISTMSTIVLTTEKDNDNDDE